jgi:hypothetical protein
MKLKYIEDCYCEGVMPYIKSEVLKVSGLKDLMENNTFEVLFTKSDGNLRLMPAMWHNYNVETGAVTVVDLNLNEFRKFYIGDVKEAVINNVRYKKY